MIVTKNAKKRREGHYSAETSLPVCFLKENPRPALSSEMVSRYYTKKRKNATITKCYNPIPSSDLCRNVFQASTFCDPWTPNYDLKPKS